MAGPSLVNADVAEWLAHVKALAEGIGPRGPTREGERRGSEYARDFFLRTGLQPVWETFRGARSGFHSSVNYRSVVVLGTAKMVEGKEKAAALEIISEQILPGRWADIRWPNRKELKATTVLKIGIGEASAKIRTGPPLDDEDDYALKCWAGVLPLQLTPGKPVADSRLPRNIPVPAYARKWPRPRGAS